MKALLALLRADLILYFSNRRALAVTFIAPVLIAAFALVTGLTELVVAIGGEKLLERKAKKAFAPPRRSTMTTPQPSH